MDMAVICIAQVYTKDWRGHPSDEYHFEVGYETDLRHPKDLLVEARATIASEYYRQFEEEISEIKIKNFSTFVGKGDLLCL